MLQLLQILCAVLKNLSGVCGLGAGGSNHEAPQMLELHTLEPQMSSPKTNWNGPDWLIPPRHDY